MLQLYIDNLPAVVKNGTTFKLTRENPAFSQQGDYTFEVTLPLAGCVENQRIYGPVHRIESKHRQLLTSKPFHLASPLVTLTGKATVQSVSEDEIKVQLTAGRSDSNFTATDSDGNDIYIDQLPLGTVFDEYDLRGEIDAAFAKGKSYHFEWFKDKITNSITLADYLCATGNDFHRQHGTWRETSVVFYPFFLADDEKTTENELNFHSLGYSVTKETHLADTAEAGTTTGDTASTATKQELSGLYTQYTLGDRVRVWPKTHDDKVTFDIKEVAVFPQPRLYEILRRILEALGYTLLPFEDDFVRSVFILQHTTDSASTSADESIQYARMLPHVTVQEFITEFNNFFSTILTFDERRRATLHFRSDFYNTATTDDTTGDTKTVELTDVEEELDVDFADESAANNSSTGNVDYDWPTTDDQLRLPDEVWERARILHFADYKKATTYYNALTTAQKEASDFLLIDDSTGYVYASLKPANADTYQLARVDYYPPLIRDDTSRDITTTLKIVPARMTRISDGGSHMNTTTDYATDPIPILVSTTSYGTAATSININVNATINPDNSSSDDDSSSDETSTTEASEYIEVALGLGDVATSEGAYFMTSEVENFDKYSITWKDESGMTIGGEYPEYTTTFYLSAPPQLVPVPLSVPYFKNELTGLLDKLKIELGSNHPVTGANPFLLTDSGEMHLTGQGPLELITTRIEHCFKFLATKPIDITAPFLIHGRRYACHKLEYTIHPDYVAPSSPATSTNSTNNPTQAHPRHHATNRPTSTSWPRPQALPS